MKPRCWAVILGAVTIAIGVTGLVEEGRSRAQVQGGGALDTHTVRVTVVNLGAGTFPGPGLPAHAPSHESAHRWDRSEQHARCVVFKQEIPLGVIPFVGPLPGPPFIAGHPRPGPTLGAPIEGLRLDDLAALPKGALVVGSLVIYTATPRSGTGDVIVVPQCEHSGDAPLSGPPSPVDAWEEMVLPRSSVHASPPGTKAWPGIVRLTSHFWPEPVAPVQVTVSVHGYEMTVTARPTAYAWDFGNGATQVDAAPATPGAPDLTNYRTRRDYGVVLYVVWEAIAHTSMPAWGMDFGDQYLGTVTIPEHASYRVGEIRPRLRVSPKR
jgi:hypothetical protein